MLQQLFKFGLLTWFLLLWILPLSWLILVVFPERFCKFWQHNLFNAYCVQMSAFFKYNRFCQQKKTFILLEFLISVISVPSFSWKWLFGSWTLSMMLITSFLKCSNSVHHGEWYLDLNPKDVLVLFPLLLPFKKKCVFHCMPSITLSSFSINVSWHELEFFWRNCCNSVFPWYVEYTNSALLIM